jgi:hypothetical protein
LILHKNFVWLHLPRTGGTATTSWLKQVDLALQLKLNITPQGLPAKHDNVNIRSLRLDESFDSKIITMNFRSLPEWLMSNYHFALSTGLKVPFERYMEGEFFSLRVGQWCLADWWLEYFEVGKISHFMNVQHLEEDWRKFLKEACGVIVPKEIQMKIENENSKTLSIFNSVMNFNWDIAYAQNPIWKSIENSLNCKKP